MQQSHSWTQDVSDSGMCTEYFQVFTSHFCTAERWTRIGFQRIGDVMMLHLGFKFSLSREKSGTFINLHHSIGWSSKILLKEEESTVWTGGWLRLVQKHTHTHLAHLCVWGGFWVCVQKQRFWDIRTKNKLTAGLYVS